MNFCNFENIFYFYYLSKVARRIRFPIFHVFPAAFRGNIRKAAFTDVARVLVNSEYKLSMSTRRGSLFYH